MSISTSVREQHSALTPTGEHATATKPRWFRPESSWLSDVLLAAALGGLVWLAAAAINAVAPPVLVLPGGRVVSADRWLLFAMFLRGSRDWLVVGPVLALVTLRISQAIMPRWAHVTAHVLVAMLTLGGLRAASPLRRMPAMRNTSSGGGAPRSIGFVRGSPGLRATVSGPPAPVQKSDVASYAVIVLGAGLVETVRRRTLAQRAASSEADRAARLQGQLASVRLDALRTQLQPHFLNNTLNTIAGLIDVDPEGAKEMVAKLGGLLRETLRVTEPAVTLARELEWLDAYLEIQHRRFGDRLRVEIDADASTLAASVPFLILQPLVENALQHGLGGGGGRHEGLIEIASKMRGDRIVLTVTDNGIGFGRAAGNGTGVGLSNTRARLDAMYGSHASLQVEPLGTHGTRATVEIPAPRRSANNHTQLE